MKKAPFFYCNQEREMKKKWLNYNTQTILSKKIYISKNKSALFLHRKYQQSRLINTIFQKRKVIYLSTDPTTPTVPYRKTNHYMFGNTTIL
jgi:hypothetical protein